MVNRGIEDIEHCKNEFYFMNYQRKPCITYVNWLNTRFFYKQQFYMQRQAEIGKKSSKS